MNTTNSIILNDTEVNQKIRRIAYQIYEANSEETEVVLAGIAENGYLLTQKLAAVLEEISPLQLILCKVTMNKKSPINSVQTSLTPEEYTDKSLVLIDDVLHSGTTLVYGVKHFLEVPLKRFKTAVLVNRNHKKYPVKADFKGLSLSTSIKEHVVVEFKEHETIAYLS
ncbi:Phosphoribosyltransferase [Tenacibaculum litopenaei]|jgi:pyrimidine operon attenuation protein/uracil phosphoribosyltransferase|uniref:phosphoribosyltransferase family protein n=1 Tax=Tenacibaculum litopenaei TaxID=396016 RepID=UPI00389368C9